MVCKVHLMHQIFTSKKTMEAIRPSLGFPSPRLPSHETDFSAWQALDVSICTGVLLRRYGPIPTHIFHPLKPRFPGFRVITCHINQIVISGGVQVTSPGTGLFGSWSAPDRLP